MTVWYLGTNFGHDASAALIDQDGVVHGAVEEGRIVGVKNCSTFPSRGITALLEAAGEPLDIQWLEGWHWPRRLLHKGLGASLRYGAGNSDLVQARALKELRRWKESRTVVREWEPRLGSPRFVGHHLSHALSLVPWHLPPASIVLVSDTTGETESVSVWHWDGQAMAPISRSPWPHSPGAVLHQAAYHLGFIGERGPGKLMALSAYGDRDRASLPADMATVGSATFRVNLRRFPTHLHTGAWARAGSQWQAQGRSSVAELVTRSAGAEERGADFAAVVQAWFESVLLNLTRQSVALARSRGLSVSHVGLAGGSALNCQANGRLYRELDDMKVESLVVSPWSNDAGTALGAAVFGALADGVRSFQTRSPMLGPRAHVSFGHVISGLSDAVLALQRGEVIGLVSSGVEFGPRALGGRCLLADPTNPRSKHRLNEMKGRPQFMPLAPAIRRDTAARWFLGAPSGDMAWTVQFTVEAASRFPGIAHPSGETRVQAVDWQKARVLCDLLVKCEQAGMPMLLLTSLNGPGEPMLSDPTAAERAAYRLGAVGCLTDDGWHDACTETK